MNNPCCSDTLFSNPHRSSYDHGRKRCVGGVEVCDRADYAGEVYASVGYESGGGEVNEPA